MAIYRVWIGKVPKFIGSALIDRLGLSVLRDLEWRGDGGQCPVCRQARSEGHAKPCRLAARLTTARQERVS